MNFENDLNLLMDFLFEDNMSQSLQFDTSAMDTTSSLVDTTDIFDFDLLESDLVLKGLPNCTTHSTNSLLSSTTSSEPDLIRSMFFDELISANCNPLTEPTLTKTTVRSNIYKWTSEAEIPSSINTLELDVDKLNPFEVSRSVSLTISRELDLHDYYLKNIIGRTQGHSKRRKRRNPQYDDLEWLPVSLFQAAYTNIKNSSLDKTDYQYRIP